MVLLLKERRENKCHGQLAVLGTGAKKPGSSLSLIKKKRNRNSAPLLTTYWRPKSGLRSWCLLSYLMLIITLQHMCYYYSCILHKETGWDYIASKEEPRLALKSSWHFKFVILIFMLYFLLPYHLNSKLGTPIWQDGPGNLKHSVKQGVYPLPTVLLIILNV